MPVFVVLAWAIALFVVGMVAVALVQVVRQVRGLTSGVRAASGRIVPLATDLQSELAVTSAEIESLSAAVERGQRERRERARSRPRRRSRRSGRRQQRGRYTRLTNL